ncbi:hypothetical protein Tco_0558778 [Tanacetum coccineum]
MLMSLNVLPTLELDFIPSSESIFAYVVWIFLPFLFIPVIPPYLLSCGDEDTIFDPGISKIKFPLVSSRIHKFLVWVKHRDPKQALRWEATPCYIRSVINAVMLCTIGLSVSLPCFHVVAYCPGLPDSGYQQKDRKQSQNDKTEHEMEKTVQNQGQSPKMSSQSQILKNHRSNRKPELKNTIDAILPI